jgi:hypothetical protein
MVMVSAAVSLLLLSIGHVLTPGNSILLSAIMQSNVLRTCQIS